MTILITGAAGFIGFHLARRLITDGHWVHGIDNLNDYYDPRLKQARLSLLIPETRFSFERLDLADSEAIGRLFRERGFDAVVNLAAQVGVRYSLENPLAYVSSNLVGFVNVLEGCIKARVSHLVFASSSSVYGASVKVPFSVRDPTDNPVSLYAATKKANELIAHSYSHLYDLPTTGLRLFTVYGPWGRPDMAYYKFVRAIEEGRPIDLYHNGEMQRDFTYVDDVVEGITRVLKAPPKRRLQDEYPSESVSKARFRLYNVGNGQTISLPRLVDIIEDALSKKAIRNYLPMQPGDLSSTHADNSVLFRDVGFAPHTPLETGIRNFVRWYQVYYQTAGSAVPPPLATSTTDPKPMVGSRNRGTTNSTGRIRILQVVPCLVPGGAEYFVLNLVCQLDPECFNVAVVSLYEPQGTELEERLRAQGVAVCYLGKTLGFDIRIFGRLARAIKEFRPQVVHTHLHALNYTIPSIPGALAGRVVHTVHGVAERERAYIGSLAPRFVFGRWVAPVAVARQVQASIRRVYRSESVLIPNGIPVQTYRTTTLSRMEWRQKQGFTAEDVLFVSAGRLHPDKNHSLLIEAFARGPAKSRGAHLIIAGDGNLHDELRLQVETSQLQGKVHLLGHRGDIPDVLGACDVYAFASQNEGSPLSVMEAMAAGLPVIGTAVGGVPELVLDGRNGALVPPGARDALADSMCKVYYDPCLRAAMAQQSRERGAEFDIAHTAADYSALYRTLLRDGEAGFNLRRGMPLR